MPATDAGAHQTSLASGERLGVGSSSRAEPTADVRPVVLVDRSWRVRAGFADGRHADGPREKIPHASARSPLLSVQPVAPSKRLRPLSHFAWSVLVGIVAALAAVVFRGLIALFHNLLFLGQVSVVYDANAHTPASPWGPFVILVPVIGAAGVAFLVSNFAPGGQGAWRARGDGRDLLPQGRGPARSRGHQVAGVRTLDWQRRFGRPRGADRSDRIFLRLDPGPVPARAGMAAGHADRRGRRCRHRRDVQHADRRRPLRRRDHASRGQCADARSRDNRHGDRSVHRPTGLWQPSVVRQSPRSRLPISTSPTRSFCCSTPGWACSRVWPRQPISARSMRLKISSTTASGAITTAVTCWAWAWWGSSCTACSPPPVTTTSKESDIPRCRTSFQERSHGSCSCCSGSSC